MVNKTNRKEIEISFFKKIMILKEKAALVKLWPNIFHSSRHTPESQYTMTMLFLR